MSLLLDALRKSERQRKLGQAPDIEVPSMRSETSPRRPYGWLLLLVLLAAGVGWWLLVDSNSDGSGRDQAVVPDQALDQAKTDQTRTTDNAAAMAADTRATAAAPAAKLAASNAMASGASGNEQQAQTPARLPQQRGAAFTLPPPRTSLPPAASDQQQATATEDRRGALSRDLPTAMDTAPQSAASLDDLARLAETSAQIEAEDTNAVANASAVTDDAAPSSAATTAASDDEVAPESEQATGPPAENWRPGQPELISYYDLPVSVRQELADFRVTIRIYNDDPSQRFAVINQQRFFEGDDVGQGLRLLEIRRDGVVFEFDQYRFLLQ